MRGLSADIVRGCTKLKNVVKLALKAIFIIVSVTCYNFKVLVNLFTECIIVCRHRRSALRYSSIFNQVETHNEKCLKIRVTHIRNSSTSAVRI